MRGLGRGGDAAERGRGAYRDDGQAVEADERCAGAFWVADVKVAGDEEEGIDDKGNGQQRDGRGEQPARDPLVTHVGDDDDGDVGLWCACAFPTPLRRVACGFEDTRESPSAYRGHD